MKDVLDSIKWPAALVILGAMALLGFMFHRGATLEALGTFLVLLLGYQAQQQSANGQRLQQVESNTNGVNAGLRTQIDSMSAQLIEQGKLMAALASRVPANTPLPPALEQAGLMPVSVPPAVNGHTVPLPRVGDDPL